jgi:hypothetical protein
MMAYTDSCFKVHIYPKTVTPALQLQGLRGLASCWASVQGNQVDAEGLVLKGECLLCIPLPFSPLSFQERILKAAHTHDGASVSTRQPAWSTLEHV